MSQAGIVNTGSSPPGSGISTITNQDGSVVGPDGAGNVNYTAETSTRNDSDGVFTVGNAGTNTFTVQLTNRIQGDITTVNATPTTVISFALGVTPGVYSFTGEVTAYDVTDSSGASYGLVSGIRTDGITATEIGTQFTTNFEEPSMLTADVDVTVSGNNAIFQVTGIAAKTINWDGLFNYRFVS